MVQARIARNQVLKNVSMETAMEYLTKKGSVEISEVDKTKAWVQLSGFIIN